MRHCLTMHWLVVVLFLSVSCDDGSGTGGPDSGVDMATDMAGDTAAGDSVVSDGVGDTTDDDSSEQLDDLGPDLPESDTTSDSLGETVECQTVNCNLYCEFGYAKDKNGCEVCECLECKNESNCPLSLKCPAATCVEGVCVCSCDGMTTHEYSCPDGTLVPFCTCGSEGFECLDHPEYQCEGICQPGMQVTSLCPDFVTEIQKCACETAKTVRPVCHEGPEGTGWYDADNLAALIKLADCVDCQAVCQNIGTDSEGWYDLCSGDVLITVKCAPEVSCSNADPQKCPSLDCSPDQVQSFDCPNGNSVNICGCTGVCGPSCKYMTTDDEGWYDSCSGALVKKEKCKGCVANCDLIGSKSEGWYSSCSGLITWDQCSEAKHFWECQPDAWEACFGGVECTLEGGQMNLTGNSSGICCPGLTKIPAAAVDVDGESCLLPGCDCYYCTMCGDGVCLAPENACSCPADCSETECDPVAQTGCQVGQQCSVVAGEPACGPVSTVPVGDKCDSNGLCSPGNTCGPISQCWPICQTDADCEGLPNYYDECMTKPDETWGLCIVYL